MWQRFTERARRVVFFAQEEAGRLGENYVSTEHLLLGLIRENDSVAARVLDRLGVSLGRVRSEIERQVARGDGKGGQDMQLTPRAKKVIDFAHDEARDLNNNYIGTEHLLLGLIREGDGLAGLVLNKLGVDLERTRREVIIIQNAAEEAQAGERAATEAHQSSEAGIAEMAQKVAAELARLEASGVRGRLRELAQAKAMPAPDAAASVGQTGDLGVARAAEGRARVEVAGDAAAFVRLHAVFAARDTHGYRAMSHGDQTLFFVADGTRLKLLAPPPASENAPSGGCYVRVLEGEYEGYAGWIFDLYFERTGPDEAPFPPDIEAQ